MKLNKKLGTRFFRFSRLLSTLLDNATTMVVLSSRRKRCKTSLMMGRKWWWYSDMLLKWHYGLRSPFHYLSHEIFPNLKILFSQITCMHKKVFNNLLAFNQIYPPNCLMVLQILAGHWQLLKTYSKMRWRYKSINLISSKKINKSNKCAGTDTSVSYESKEQVAKNARSALFRTVIISSSGNTSAYLGRTHKYWCFLQYISLSFPASTVATLVVFPWSVMY